MLAAADDALGANGIDTLSFNQAVGAARKLVGIRRAEVETAARGPVETVKTAVDSYILERENKELAHLGSRGARRDSRSRLTRHVLSSEPLAAKPLFELTEKDLRDWRNGLSPALAPATKRRLINDLRAALNRAGRRSRAQLPAAFEREVRGGLAVDDPMPPVPRSMQILTDDEVRRIVEAAKRKDQAADWDGALFRLILMLAATGARFSQLTRMSVADAQLRQRRLLVPVSMKGRGEKAVTRIAVPIGDDVIANLEPAVKLRGQDDPLLLRPRWKQLTPTKWQKVGADVWKNASELTRPWKTIVAEAGLPAETVPYALRHSSIVRSLRVGLPTRLVAASHDTSVEMIESHYSAHVVSAFEELSARAIVPLTTG